MKKLTDIAIEICPVLEEEAEQGEAERNLTGRAVQTMREAGLYHMFLPIELGGLGTDPLTFLDVASRVSYAHGSAGWCLVAAVAEIACAGAFLTDDGVGEIFRQGSTPLIHGAGFPPGKAVLEADTYRISGDWKYGSGISHADYVHTGCFVMQGNKIKVQPNGIPEIRIFNVPRDSFTVIDDWQALGLRATGSFDYTGHDLLVPSRMSHNLEATAPKRGGNFFSIGMIGLTAIGQTSFALGVAKRALDEIAPIAASKKGLLGTVGENAHFQLGFARASASLSAARAYVKETWHEINYVLGQGKQLNLKQVAHMRACFIHSQDVAVQTADFAYHAGGGIALRPSVLQRCFRDIQASRQHVLTSNKIFQDCGKVLAGLSSERDEWAMVGLLDNTRV